MKIFAAIAYLIGLLLAALFASSQSKSDKMYDTFNGNEAVFSFSFSKSMIDAINIDLGDDGDEKNVTGDLHYVRFMSYNPKKGTMSAEKFIRKAEALLPAQYKKIKDNNDDLDVDIWLLGNRKEYTECHIFIRNEDANGICFVVSFIGNFTVNDLKKLKKAGKEIAV